MFEFRRLPILFACGPARQTVLAHADATPKRLRPHKAAPWVCMSRHFNNLEDLTETTAPDNPALDYNRMKSGTIDNQCTGAAFD
jgi:hypothetical protein